MSTYNDDVIGRLLQRRGVTPPAPAAPIAQPSPPPASPRSPDGGGSPASGAQQHVTQPKPATPPPQSTAVLPWREHEIAPEPYNPHRPPNKHGGTTAAASLARPNELLDIRSHDLFKIATEPTWGADVTTKLPSGDTRSGRPAPFPGRGKTSPTAKGGSQATTRKKVVSDAMEAVGAGDIAYSEGGNRMSGVTGKVHPPAMPKAADCSSFVTWLYYAAGANDPNGKHYNGTGYTGTLWENGHRTTSPKPGDLVFFGSPTASDAHVAVYIGNGLVVSQGGPGPGPRVVSVAAEAAYENRGVYGYRSYFP